MIFRTSLKMRLGVGAALLGLGACFTALLLWFGMGEVAKRLDTALASERRMGTYAALSSQAAAYLVVATEVVQSQQPVDVRRQRITAAGSQMRETFARLQDAVAEAVQDAQDIGFDAQSRFGTQSLGLARMSALLDSTTEALGSDTTDAGTLSGHINIFSSSFDPLLGEAVSSELQFRNTVLNGIDRLREQLRLVAIGLAACTLLAATLFYFAIIRPQFQRLDKLRAAAQQIGQEDFSVDLPEGQADEIGQLFGETNRMASALSDRQSQVQKEWERLNETIAERTEELRAANAQLAEIDENRRRFFADISHELRTPLTVILMESQIGAQGGGDNRQAFETIEARAARLNRRIEDLLRVARSESGQLQLETQSVPLTNLIAQVEEEVAAEVHSAGMLLDVQACPDISLQVDPNWVRQVLVSLLRNAIRHARSGGKIMLSAVEIGGHAEISVIDNGNGISDTDKVHVFDRFFQGSGSSQGFGLGLALVRWVVEEHGGTISLESPLPRDRAIGDAPGTKIAVRLPLVSN